MALVALLLILILTPTLNASAETGESYDNRIQSEDDYVRVFDEETEGSFTRLLAAPDARQALDLYPKWRAKYVEITEALFDAYSPHANTLPHWYGKQLLAMGLGQIGEDEAALAYFEAELSTGDFDRVVGGFHVLGGNDFPLLGPTGSTPLWRSMINRAKADTDDRYWISLRLAEFSLLDPASFDAMATKQITRFESVHENIGRNAEELGTRIHRLIGLQTGLRENLKVQHPRIRFAKIAASDRVRKFDLLTLGGPAAYGMLEAEREELRARKHFPSHRFGQLVRKDLNWAFYAYGLPREPRELIATLRDMCRNEGQNRLSLWDTADDLSDIYEWELSKQSTPVRTFPTVEEILAKGKGAEAFVLAALQDPEDLELMLHLFDADVVPALIDRRKPKDAEALRAALRQAFYQLGYPRSSRPHYLAALEALGPSKQAGLSNAENQRELTQRFDKVSNLPEFDSEFAVLRHSSGIATSSNHALVASFVSAVVRLGQPEANRLRRATKARGIARLVRDEASADIDDAERAIENANVAIRTANLALEAAEAEQQEAVAARNRAVTELNASYDAVNAALRATRAGTSTQEALAEARAQLADAERTLNPKIKRIERNANRVAQVADEAAQRAIDELARATREEAKALRAAQKENDAMKSGSEAEVIEAKSRIKVSHLLSSLALGFELLGVAGDEEAVGNPDADPSQQMAGVGLLMERAHDGESIRDAFGALENAKQSQNKSLADLAKMGLELGGAGARRNR